MKRTVSESWLLGGNCTETENARPAAAAAGVNVICTGVDPSRDVSAADTSACGHFFLEFQ